MVNSLIQLELHSHKNLDVSSPPTTIEMKIYFVDPMDAAMGSDPLFVKLPKSPQFTLHAPISDCYFESNINISPYNLFDSAERETRTVLNSIQIHFSLVSEDSNSWLTKSIITIFPLLSSAKEKGSNSTTKI
jgi:hypothetical protein